MSSALRILAIDARVPTPEFDGGSLRLCRILAILRDLGHDVALVPSFPRSFPPFDASLARDEDALDGLGISQPARATRETVEEHLSSGVAYDLIWITGAYVAHRHARSVRTLQPLARLVFDTIDLHHLREYRAAKLSGNVHQMINALNLKRIELATARMADLTVVVSDREGDVLRREDPQIRTWLVPNVHDVIDRPPGFAARAGLLYLGAFTFAPNVDAVQHLVTRIMPATRALLPDVRLDVVGSHPTAEVLALASDHVRIHGFVPDLFGHFAAARVFTAPLLYGAGIKGKVLLAMAHGLPVVASPVAVEGIPARPGIDVMVADTPGAWPAVIGAVYTDQALWERLSTGGRELVRRHYSAARSRDLLGEMLELLGLTRRGANRGG
jgi:glycosyltransferase involved in cell wall biosynthesis